MENFFAFLPTTFLGWLAALVFTAGAIIIRINQVRNSDLKELRETIQDKKNRIDDLEKTVDQLKNQSETQDKRMQTQIDSQSALIKELQVSNKNLQDLVHQALKDYFVANPTVAAHLLDKIGIN